VLGLGGAFVASYPSWRSWCLTWGARTDEVQAKLPGDELLDHPDLITTRAVSIEGRATAI
jgi:hypothetical protein